MKTNKLFLLVFAFFIYYNLSANNLQITESPVLSEINTTEGHASVTFSVSWENSWKTSVAPPYNHDAIWVFIKYRIMDGEWRHGTLYPSNHTVPIIATYDIPTDNKGAFIFRGSDGSGDITLNDVVLKWNFDLDGVSAADMDYLSLKVFAIEMVYVPEGAFYVGDGNTSSVLGVFHEIGTTDPYFIENEASITLGGITAGDLGNSHTGDGQHNEELRDDFNNSAGAEKTLPASYPKGYNAFYLMKYNITQKQYVDFLNTLTREQQNRRTATNIASSLTSVTNRYVMTNTNTPSSRNGIRVDYTFHPTEPLMFYNDLNDDGTPNQSDDGQHLPLNFVGFADGAAYADWACLRPMTELEYEKSTRGSQSPVLDEMAWGEAYNLGVTAIVIEGINNSGFNNELPTNATANCHINNNDGNIDGPVRAGIFSTSTSSRHKSGAGYFGAMDMGGNLTEQVITLGNAEGRGFDGLHGDGELASTGVNNVPNWPGSNSTTLSDVSGAGIRSNSFASVGMGSRISVRRFVNQAQQGRSRSMGFRLVRTAP